MSADSLLTSLATADELNETTTTFGCVSMVGENFDSNSNPDSTPQKPAKQRRYLGVHFACCGVYSRVYVNQEATEYAGNCPKCSRRITFRIGSGGTDTRFFTAY